MISNELIVMEGFHDILPVKQEQAINLLLLGTSKRDIAKELKIKESTLYNWLTMSRDFNIELKIRRKQFSHDCKVKANLKMSAMLDKAISNIESIMDNSDNETLKAKISLEIIKNFDIYNSVKPFFDPYEEYNNIHDQDQREIEEEERMSKIDKIMKSLV